jgi:hypothetical protein
MSKAIVSDPEDDLLLDRRHIALLSTEVLGPGAKVSVFKIEKLAIRGKGPPVDYLLGPKQLTRKCKAVAWLRSLLRVPAGTTAKLDRVTEQADATA